MYNPFKKKTRATWFPGQTVIRDRWGEQQNRVTSNPEFSTHRARSDDTLRHMRWGLGLM